MSGKENDYYQYGGIAKIKKDLPDGVISCGSLFETKPHCGIILESSDTSDLTMDVSEKHCLIVGSPGSGKTRRLIMETILSACGTDDSIVCSDPKGELLSKTAGILEAHGFKIVVVDFRDPVRSTRWNPLAYAYKLMSSGDPVSVDRAYMLLSEIASVICPVLSKREPYWETAGQELIFAFLIITVKEAERVEEATIDAVYERLI